MEREKAERLAQLLFQTAPPFRRNYIRPHDKPNPLPRLPHHHMFCLMILRHSGQMNMGTLAEKLGVSSQQCTRIVGELVGGGLAERVFDEANRRAVFVAPTPKGNELLCHYYRLACDHIAERLAPLSDEDVDALIEHLAAIGAIFDKLD